MSQPARSRYAATSPDLLRWFKSYNTNRNYRDQVKPFGFMLAFSEQQDHSAERIVTSSKKGRPKKATAIKPIAPFERDAIKAAAMAFDRVTGQAVAASSLRTYADALFQYHISPEAKFLNGDYLDKGITQRRHVYLANVHHIGKEAHDWERHAMLGTSADGEISYSNRTNVVEAVSALIAEFGHGPTAKAFGMSSRQLAAALRDAPESGKTRFASSLTVRLPKVVKTLRQAAVSHRKELQQLRTLVDQYGLREAARKEGLDPSNLRRRITQRKL